MTRNIENQTHCFLYEEARLRIQVFFSSEFDTLYVKLHFEIIYFATEKDVLDYLYAIQHLLNI